MNMRIDRFLGVDGEGAIIHTENEQGKGDRRAAMRAKDVLQHALERIPISGLCPWWNSICCIIK